MKVTLQSLKSYVDVPADINNLTQKLAMAGIEVDKVEPVSHAFKNVVVGLVTEIQKQGEDTNHLQVQISTSKTIQILVRGGASVKKNALYAIAPIGAYLPSIGTIETRQIQGLPSKGMICKARELGLGDNDEWVEFPPDIPLGTDVYKLLELDDLLLELNITPNRGDCLSFLGVARELSVLFNIALPKKPIPNHLPQLNDNLNATVALKAACPHFCLRLIKGVNNQKASPIWLREKLRRCGIRSVNLLVDISNYVMLELGQPLHAYDESKIKGSLSVRMAKAKESLVLLDGQKITLHDKTLIIADTSGPVGIAGIMGGQATSVDEKTTDIILESAFFAPEAIAGIARSYGLTTEASQRFERGVDPQLQKQALERATELIIQLSGGKFTPIFETIAAEHLPQPKLISFRKSRMEELLGLTMDESKVIDIFERLGFTVLKKPQAWDIRIPTYRFDIHHETDLIEEVARIDGYEKIPITRSKVDMIPPAPKPKLLNQLSDILVARGYYESITYSFVDKMTQNHLDPKRQAISLMNPLSAELEEMQTTLWSSLLKAVQLNQNRQQTRVRLFESGLVFKKEDTLKQKLCIAGVCYGPVYPEQWAVSKDNVDFFSIKSDVEALLSVVQPLEHYRFVPMSNSKLSFQDPLASLHPGQSAYIIMPYFIDNKVNSKLAMKEPGLPLVIGSIGALHPKILQALDLEGPIYVFELELEKLLEKHYLKTYQPLSKFPSLRRDISFFINKNTLMQDIKDTIYHINCEFLQEIAIFDVYEGTQVQKGKKSVALGLILQHPTRTLVDEEVNKFVQQVVHKLEKEYDIELRDT